MLQPFRLLQRPHGKAGVGEEEITAVHIQPDVLEMDVRQTADGELVVIHDESVDRTTNGRGQVAELSYQQLAELDAAYHWMPAWTLPEDSIPPYRGEGIYVPTLKKVLEEFPDQRLNIELKLDSEQAADALCSMIKAHGAQQRTLVASEHSASIRAFREACPSTPTATAYSETVGFLVNQTARLLGFYHPRAYALEIPPQSHGFELLTAARVQDAKEQGMHVLPWTINDQSEMHRLLALGVSGIITDYPDRMLHVLNN